MIDYNLLLLVFVAIAIGWLLGRRSGNNEDESADSITLSRSYFKGLNYLLNEQPDSAIDAFIDALEVSPETLETHLAIGNLLRRKGEVDRAIKVHQNLLARPSLNTHQLHQAQLELAKDFINAGLLDRAERLLQELVEASSELKNVCLTLLIEIYRDEKEWEKAIHAVNLLVGRRFTKMPLEWAQTQAHFCCELAQASLDNKDYLSSRRYLKQALGYDRDSVRASLLWGQLELLLDHPRQALKILKKIPQQDAEYLPEAIGLIKQCFEKLDNIDGLQKFLQQMLELYPSNSLVLAMTDSILKASDDLVAADFIGKQLKTRPSVRGLSRLLELYLRHTKGSTQDNLHMLKELIDGLIATKPSYRCRHCGFTGNQLHWLCPSCKTWSSIKAIQGVEGE